MKTSSASPETLPAEAAQIQGSLDVALAAAEEVTIDSPEMYELAGREIQTATAAAKRLEELRLSITRPMDEAKRRVLELFAVPIDRAGKVRATYQRAMLVYDQAQERARREAERKAREEAERARRAEQAALEQRQREEQERLRIAAEAERKAREEREQAQRELQAAEEAAQNAGTAEEAQAALDKMQAASERAEAAGEQEAQANATAQDAGNAVAEVQAEAAATAAAPVIPCAVAVQAAPRVAGVSRRTNWKFRIVDRNALIKAAAAELERGNPVLAGLLEPNETAIGAMARALKENAAIPGVEVYAEAGLAVGGR